MREPRKFIFENKTIQDILPEVTKSFHTVPVTTATRDGTVPVITATAEKSFNAFNDFTWNQLWHGTWKTEPHNYSPHQTVLDEMDLRSLVKGFVSRTPDRKLIFAFYDKFLDILHFVAFV